MQFRRAVEALAFAVVVLAALELCWREVARHSLLGISSWAPWQVAAVAMATAIPALLISSRGIRTLLLFATLFATGVAAQLHLGARLQSDGFYYYAYLRSMAFDGDVEFSNDYRLLGLGDKAHLFQQTTTGHAQSAWTIGPAIVWSPFFAAGHLAARHLAQTDARVSTDGISFPYRQAVCIAGLFYGLLGCWFCYRAASRLHSSSLAAMATLSVTAGSFMLWYLVKEPSMTHAPSMAAVAGFTWLWLATRTRRLAGDGQSVLLWALLGGVAGFIALIRWQNALFAILPACDSIVFLARGWRSSRTPLLRGAIVSGLVFTACATLAFVPQMLAWKAIYGTWLAVSPVGPQIRWSDPHLSDILWSSRNGLFSWSAVLYLAAVGLLLFAIRQPGTGIPLLVACALMTYFNACIQDWWGSDGFGARRFDGLIPLFTIGFATTLAALIASVRRRPARWAIAVLSLLVVWNVTLMHAAQTGRARLGEAVSFGDLGSAQVAALHEWIGMPSTYPASLLFAWRGSASPADYDLLSANRMLGDPLRPYGRIDVGAPGDESLVEGGWHAAERDGATTFRWVGADGMIRIPLDHRAPLKVQIRVRPFAFGGAPPQQLALTINGHTFGPVPIGDDWQVVEFDTPADAWRGSVNRLALRFARETRPADIGMGGDTRALAAAVDYVRVEVIGARR